jgi:hypothetical protein
MTVLLFIAMSVLIVGLVAWVVVEWSVRSRYDHETWVLVIRDADGNVIQEIIMAAFFLVAEHMKKLLTLRLLVPTLCWGQTYPNPTFLAPSGGTARAMQSHFSDVINLLDYGADPTGVADSSTALAAAIAQVNTDYGLSPRVLKCIYVPTGSYKINNATAIPAFGFGVPGCVYGDGPHKSSFTLGSSFVGDLFAWSEAWEATSGCAYTNGMTGTTDCAGPHASGFTVFGNTGSASQQNVLRFYDRNAHATVRDIEVFYLNGQCLSIGRTSAEPQAWMAESTIENVRCWNAGTSSQPAFEISETTTSGSEGTNEITFTNINVFNAAGRCVVVSSPQTFTAIAKLKFVNLRTEQCGGDGFTIGLSTDAIATTEIQVYNFEDPNILTGTYGLVIGAQSSTITIHGVELGHGSDAGGGINLNAGPSVSIGMIGLGLSGTAINVQSTSYGSNIYYEGGSGQLPAITTAQTFSGALGFTGPINLWGTSIINAPKVGFYALQGSGSGATIRLTADGNTASANNTFNPGFSVQYGISNFTANCLDITTLTKSYAWTLPIAEYQNFYSAATATWTPYATPFTVTQGTVTGAGFAASADTTNGGINLTFTTPTSNTDTWHCEALFQFVKSS